MKILTCELVFYNKPQGQLEQEIKELKVNPVPSLFTEGEKDLKIIELNTKLSNLQTEHNDLQQEKEELKSKLDAQQLATTEPEKSWWEEHQNKFLYGGLGIVTMFLLLWIYRQIKKLL